MWKPLATALLAASMLSSCNQVANDNPAEICSALLGGDPDIESDLVETGSDIEGYCACYASSLDNLPEQERAMVLKVSQVIADIRAERNLGVEAAAGLVEDDVEASSDGATYGVSEREFEVTGEFVDGVRNAMGDNGGQCPAG